MNDEILMEVLPEEVAKVNGCREGDVLELKVESNAFGGDGVARVGRLVVMVRGGLPGDTVIARVARKRKRYLEARIVEIVEGSPGRVKPVCELFGICGGCAMQHLAYPEQIAGKESQVADHLSRIGGIESPNVLPILGMDEPWRYRNKMEYAFSSFADGRVKLGLHSSGRYDLVIDVDDCFLQPEGCNSARNVVRDFCRERGLSTYNPRRHEGNLRHLVLRSAKGGEDVMAIVCGADDEFTEGAEIAGLLAERPEVKSVWRYVNKSCGGAAVAGRGELLYGYERLVDDILGLKMEVSATSFAQTNSRQAEVLYSTALDMCELRGDETVFDLYSGAGPISLLLARRAGRVVGIEYSVESVADARRNAAANGIDNVEFFDGEVEKVLGDFASRYKPEVMVVDPPRAGLHANALKAISEAQPERVVYVSCNPSTLARDAALLVEAGYVLDAVRPVDMFPHTYHIECVARFCRGRS